jgi:hypothetical protein
MGRNKAAISGHKTNHNTAPVIGNSSKAVAARGDFNTARVFGTGSTAMATNTSKLTVTAIGNNVHKP